MFTVCHTEEAELLPPQLLPCCPVYDTILIWFLILFPVLARSKLTVDGFFLPFLGFIAKSRLLFILEPCSLPKLFLFFSLIFYFILIPIASSFWFPPFIWWVGRLAELWGGRWRHT
jgi:hypothetical protein